MGLLAGQLTDQHYEDAFAADPRIDQLRSVMRVQEDQSYSASYLDPTQRSIANSVQVFFTDHVDSVSGHRLPFSDQSWPESGLNELAQRCQPPDIHGHSGDGIAACLGNPVIFCDTARDRPGKN